MARPHTSRRMSAKPDESRKKQPWDAWERISPQRVAKIALDPKVDADTFEAFLAFAADRGWKESILVARAVHDESMKKAAAERKEAKAAS